MTTDTDMPVLDRRTLSGVPRPPGEKEKPSASFLPLPDDDETPPGETIAMLEQARAALLKVIGALFDAAVTIVGALLSLVQTLAGRGAAEALDKTAANALDPLIPDLPASTAPSEEPTTKPIPEKTPPSEGPTERSAAGPKPPDREAVEAQVRAILVANAAEDEQPGITDQLVDLVASGVLFMTSLEARHPGLIEHVMARDATPEEPTTTDETYDVTQDLIDTGVSVGTLGD